MRPILMILPILGTCAPAKNPYPGFHAHPHNPFRKDYVNHSYSRHLPCHSSNRTGSKTFIGAKCLLESLARTLLFLRSSCIRLIAIFISLGGTGRALSNWSRNVCAVLVMDRYFLYRHNYSWGWGVSLVG